MLHKPMFPLMKYIHNSLNSDKAILKTFVIGNVSCDLDSFLCPYLLSLSKAIGIHHSYNNNQLYIPVVNCPKGEITNRFDIDYLLKRFHIDPSSLIYFNDDLVQRTIKNSKVILVDHNKPDLNQDYLSPLVTEIYDHHKDEQMSNSIKDKQNKVIVTPLGSCSTIILDRFLLPNFPIKHIDPLFSLSALLIDTENFNRNLYKNKWVDLDKDVYNRIMKHSFPFKSPMEYKQISDEYYTLIANAKNDIKKNIKLGIKGVMAKDKKQYIWNKNKGGWSVLQICLKDLLDHHSINDLIKELDRQCNNNAYQLYLLTYSDKINNKSIKTVVLYNHSLSTIQFNLLVDYILQRLGEKCFERKKILTDKAIQLNLHQSLTRKHCEPLIHQFFNKAKH